MNFLYLFNRLHSQQVGEILMVTNKPVHEVMEAYPALALDRVRGFFPSECKEELVAYIHTLQCKALYEHPTVYADDIVFRVYGVEWSGTPLTEADYMELVKSTWPGCKVAYVHMDKPMVSLLVVNETTERGCTLPADRILAKDKLATLLLSK